MAILRVRCGSSVYVQKKSLASAGAASLADSLPEFLVAADLRCFGVLVTVAEVEDGIVTGRTEPILEVEEGLKGENGGANYGSSWWNDYYGSAGVEERAPCVPEQRGPRLIQAGRCGAPFCGLRGFGLMESDPQQLRQEGLRPSTNEGW